MEEERVRGRQDMLPEDVQSLTQATFQAFGSTLDLEELLATVLQEVRRVLDVDGVSVWLSDPQTGELICREMAGLQSDIVRGWRLAPGAGFVGWVAQHGRGLIVADAQHDERHFKDVDRQTGLAIRSLLGVPLRVKGEVIGVLEAVDTEAGRFEGTDQRLLASLAAPAAIAIQNARLYEEAEAEIAERKRAEEALRESRREYKWLLESMINAFVVYDSVFDEDGTFVSCRYVYVNRAYEEIVGVTNEGVRGKTVHDVFPGTEDSWIERYGRAAVTGERETFEMYHDPTKKLYHCTVYRPWDTPDRFCVVFDDITEEKEMEEQLRRQERLAAVGQLAAGIAHDFRNLLATILIYAEMDLKMPGLPSRLKDHLRVIVEESNRATDLVQQILDFSSRAMIAPHALDLRAFISERLNVLRRTIPENVRISLETEEQANAFTVRADAARLQQVLTNLALNARDAMPEGGELRFALSRLELVAGEAPPLAGMEAGSEPTAWICLAVSDTGTGMTEEVQEHLFEPFFTTKEVNEGTGLGLAQVYGIIRQHEGAIDVESAPGQGTTFRIYLPAHEEEAHEGGADARDTAPAPGEGETILLVEDNETLRRAAQAALESLGYRVVTAANGHEALALCRSPRWTAGGPSIDLVVTDIVMPEMGGEALMRELTVRGGHPGRWFDLKAVGITGYGVEGVTEDLREVGFVEVVHKPLDIEELAQAIRRALG